MIVRLFFILFIIATALLSCTKKSIDKVQSVSDKNLLRIEHSIGMVTLNRKNFKTQDTLAILNDDNSVWYKFSFADQARFSAPPADFYPFAFHKDYFLLALKCVKVDRDRFEVFVNDEKQVIKYLPVDSLYKFYSWEDFILNYDVSVDALKPPRKIYEKPMGSGSLLEADAEYFEPLKIEGEWLQIQWNDHKKKEVLGGWINWREQERLVVTLNFF